MAARTAPTTGGKTAVLVRVVGERRNTSQRGAVTERVKAAKVANSAGVMGLAALVGVAREAAPVLGVREAGLLIVVRNGVTSRAGSVAILADWRQN
jgi:hypothetical protein